MLIHKLKCDRKYFQSIKDGSLKFDVQKNDKGFQVNDLLCYYEFDEATNSFTKEILVVRITDVLAFNPLTGETSVKIEDALSQNNFIVIAWKVYDDSCIQCIRSRKAIGNSKGSTVVLEGHCEDCPKNKTDNKVGNKKISKKKVGKK
jgi:hypothetical protein